ncbi:hypothetical protein [Aureimonas sp. AU4]|uniref:hypothetical protein n=1 Tax=Aureimonas sp. AU4 TaxID=1638163 RepID=UPI0012E349ED|nr:hypothetical protein [Aureimonas sp. AU4]
MDPFPQISGRLARGSNIDGILAELDAELASRRDLIAECEREIAALTQARDLIAGSVTRPVATAVASNTLRSLTRPSPRPRRVRAASLAETVRRATRELIRREGRPMNRVEILAHLRDVGIEIGAADPGKRVGKIVWASNEYRHVGQGYWFKDEPLPE